jgi:SAM-dependent methyltransferase
MRVPDTYFDRMYDEADDPWDLASRWYEQRKYGITMSVLPQLRYRHAFEPGCSIGTLTELLTQRCDHVTAVDVAAAALDSAGARLVAAGCRDRVTLERRGLDEPWPTGPFDLVVLSEVAYYLDGPLLAEVLRRECPRLAPGATVLAAHWRHPVQDYPLGGDEAHEVIAATPGLVRLGGYRDRDVVIDVFDTGEGASVAAREAVPGSG